MRKIFNVSLIAITLVTLSACDAGFDELNTSKVGIISLDPAIVLNNATINSSPPGGTLNYELGIVQQMISPNTGVLEGANFNKENSSNTQLIWQNYFRNVIRYTNDVITRTQSDPDRQNLFNMARILQSNAFMVLTDTYGSVPYQEGGRGYTDQLFFPAYQTQDVIYQSVIDVLTEATGELDAAGRIETNDVLYNGSIAKWKKFGYSLLLRAGMRLSKVNAAAAEDAVAAAFAGGVILANADNAKINHDANFINQVANTLNGTEAANFFLAAPFVDALKAKADPRLPAIAIRYVGANSGPDQVPAVGTTASDDQFGLPMGSTDGEADISGATLPGGGKRYAYSQVDRRRMVKRTSPLFLVTAAQTNLLLAEARFRNWIPTGNAVDYFRDGIKAHMDQLVEYDPASAVAGGDRDTYADAQVATFDGNELAQINYEYWVASFLNGSEAWANFRRSGFPALAGNPFPGRDVDFITRLTYPPSEILVNTKNVQDAIEEQGPDKLDTRVWWDQAE
jgi:hypothetical protein